MRKLHPLIAGLICLVLGIALAGAVYLTEYERRGEAFERLVERFELTLMRHTAGLYTLRAFFESRNGEVDRYLLRDFMTSSGLADRMTGAQGIGFALAQPVTAPAASRQLLEQYGIEREIWPETTQDIRFPIVMLEPLNERNAAALGYDMYAEPVRRQAMLAAWIDGGVHSSARLELVQEIFDVKQPGFLVYLPVFLDRGLSREGRPEIFGFVYAAYRASDVINATLIETASFGFGLRIYVDSAAPENLIYDSLETGSADFVGRLSFGEREWVMEGRSLERMPLYLTPLVVLITSLGLALTVAYLVATQRREVETATALAELHKSTANEKELMLGEMQHRIKNLIMRVNSMFRLTVRETENEGALAETFSKRLDALAASQDLLMRAKGGTVALADLVEQEVSNAAGTEQMNIIGGANISLSGSQAQALGLILHELSTNSLKYGALSGAEGHVEISWQISGARRARTLELFWQEHGVEQAPPASGGGFGSRLMEGLLKSSLRGEWEREMKDGTLNIRLRFPIEA